jgi:hypothetical protein
MKRVSAPVFARLELRSHGCSCSNSLSHEEVHSQLTVRAQVGAEPRNPKMVAVSAVGAHAYVARIKCECLLAAWRTPWVAPPPSRNRTQGEGEAVLKRKPPPMVIGASQVRRSRSPLGSTHLATEAAMAALTKARRAASIVVEQKNSGPVKATPNLFLCLHTT